jgi:hypothetical protein
LIVARKLHAVLGTREGVAQQRHTDASHVGWIHAGIGTRHDTKVLRVVAFDAIPGLALDLD